MEIGIIVVFVLGYLAITMEHTLRIDKLIPALAMMAICWAMIAFGIDTLPQWFDSSSSRLIENFGEWTSEQKHHMLEHGLLHHLGKTAEILMFLMGAMTIVEITDHYDGFSALKRIIKSKKKSVLLWIMAILAFVLSAIIDNLTATIVLLTILRKIVSKQEDRWWFAGMIIVAANAGGAWSPIGDVTTTMLWMGDKVTTGKLIWYLLIPSIICMLVPTLIASFLPAFRGELEESDKDNTEIGPYATQMLVLGLSAIIFVPIFKTITHLPPYVGMMLSLAVVATVAEIISNRQFKLSQIDGENEGHPHSPVHGALSKIEMPSILFFLGILLAVAALESVGHLFNFASMLNDSLDKDVMVLLLGGGSAVIDNVPLVAASLGMFTEGTDDTLWHFIAYAAGTGGSMLIIGSAAGVVAMGMEKISFFWYLKKISILAIIGYLAGAGAFILLR
ncbi:MAG: sodium:proton antiporter NhaD [Saprospiraceae bacterium]|nr:sodium:proton antiporter NhaD [Saprospiraceae bacterium]